MDGLEAVELRFNEIFEDNNSFRIDSEYFRKEFLRIESNIKSIHFNRLKNLSHKITDFGAFSQNNFIEYKETGKHFFIRNQDIKDLFISDDKIFITEDVYNKLSLKLGEYDLLLQRTGSIGKCGMVLKKDLPSSANQNLAQVKPNLNQINPYFLNTFLNCNFGQKIFERLATGNVQPWLNLGQIENIKIPIFSNNFQLQIENLVKSSYQKLEESKSLYKEAEELLLKELDLLNFKPSVENIAIKSFKESFGISGRLDSEYYQPKYDEIINKIKNYKGGFESLSNILIYIETGEYSEEYFVKDNNLKFYIRSTNISNGLVAQDEDYFVNAKNFTKFVKNGDIITARVGTLGIFGTIDKTMEGNIYSDNVLCFRLPDNLNPFVYTLFFNNSYNKMLIERLSRGSVQQRLNQETLKDLIIPIIDKSIQTLIEEKIKKSFELKEESKKLLDLAKQTVEVAIEKNEDEAMEFINQIN